MTSKKKLAPVTQSTNDKGETVLSMKISEMDQEQLEQLLNVMQRKRDELREQCIYVRQALDRKIEEQRLQGLDAEIDRLKAQRDGIAAGAVIQVNASASGADPTGG